MYDTDSDTDYATADNDEEDDRRFDVSSGRYFTKWTNAWLESSIESDLGMRFAICSLYLAFLDFAFFKHSLA